MYLFFSFYKYYAGYSQREREYSSCLLEFTFYLGNNHRNIMLLGFFPTVFFFTINSFLHDCFCLSHHFLSLECPKTWSNFPGGSDGKASAYNARDLGSIPGSGRSPGEGNATHSSILAWKIQRASPLALEFILLSWVSALNSRLETGAFSLSSLLESLMGILHVTFVRAWKKCPLVIWLTSKVELKLPFLESGLI